MSVEIIDNEKHFITTYLQLISLSTNSKASQFYSTSDYNKISTLGPTLPKIDISIPILGGSNVQEAEKINVSFKSIKPPYKFSVTLSDIPVTNTIYTVKSQLMEAVPDMTRDRLSASDIKVLVKGKVIQDTTLLADIANGNDVAFMCMVSRSSTGQASDTPMLSESRDPSFSTTEDPIQLDSAFSLSQNAWNKIHTILEGELENSELSRTILEKFKSSLK